MSDAALEPTGSEDDIALRRAEAQLAADPASRAFGVRLGRVRRGEVSLHLDVGEQMVNAHGIAHGGFLFSLADSAFAFAFGTHGVTAVTRHADVAFVSPARRGDRLTATATPRHIGTRSGVFDVTVSNGEGTVLAELRFHGSVVA